MAVTHVQTVGTGALGGTGGPVTTQTLAITSVTIGNKGIIAVTNDASNGSTITVDDNASGGGAVNTYTQLDVQGPDSNTEKVTLFWCDFTRGGSFTITAHYSGAGEQLNGVICSEYSGCKAGAPTKISQSQATPTTTTDATTSTTLTPPTQPGVLWGLTFKTNTDGTPAAGTGFTSRGTFWSWVFSGAVLSCRVEEKAISSTSAVAATFTATANQPHETFAVYLEQPATFTPNPESVAVDGPARKKSSAALALFVAAPTFVATAPAVPPQAYAFHPDTNRKEKKVVDGAVIPPPAPVNLPVLSAPLTIVYPEGRTRPRTNSAAILSYEASPVFVPVAATPVITEARTDLPRQIRTDRDQLDAVSPVIPVDITVNLFDTISVDEFITAENASTSWESQYVDTKRGRSPALYERADVSGFPPIIFPPQAYAFHPDTNRKEKKVVDGAVIPPPAPVNLPVISAPLAGAYPETTARARRPQIDPSWTTPPSLVVIAAQPAAVFVESPRLDRSKAWLVDQSAASPLLVVVSSVPPLSWEAEFLDMPARARRPVHPEVFAPVFVAAVVPAPALSWSPIYPNPARERRRVGNPEYAGPVQPVASTAVPTFFESFFPEGRRPFRPPILVEPTVPILPLILVPQSWETATTPMLVRPRPRLDGWSVDAPYAPLIMPAVAFPDSRAQTTRRIITDDLAPVLVTPPAPTLIVASFQEAPRARRPFDHAALAAPVLLLPTPVLPVAGVPDSPRARRQLDPSVLAAPVVAPPAVVPLLSDSIFSPWGQKPPRRIPHDFSGRIDPPPVPPPAPLQSWDAVYQVQRFKGREMVSFIFIPDDLMTPSQKAIIARLFLRGTRLRFLSNGKTKL